MFWEVSLHHKIRVHPMNMSSELTTKTVQSELRSAVEGTIKADIGIILAVLKIEDLSVGKVSQRSGFAIYDVKYRALVFRPLTHQVIDAFIIGVNEHGINADAGPLEIFIAKKLMPEGFEFDMENSSFTKGNVVLVKGAKIRVRIISTKPHADFTKMTATATMNDKGLGYISN